MTKSNPCQFIISSSCFHLMRKLTKTLQHSSRYFSKVSPSSYLGQTEGLAGNSKPIYEICDSKSEKSAPMYCFEGTPLSYSAFTWIMGLTNLAH
jgi:hypothetical protein